MRRSPLPLRDVFNFVIVVLVAIARLSFTICLFITLFLVSSARHQRSNGNGNGERELRGRALLERALEKSFVRMNLLKYLLKAYRSARRQYLRAE